MMSFTQAAGLVMERLQELGQISQSDVCLDRRYLTNEHRRANALLADWMIEEDLSKGLLVELLPDWKVSGASSDSSIWLVYPSSRFIPAKSKAFANFLLN